ncbi:MAG: bifunctional oligoribonuclease/PAP phosphatase NrnA [Candidatus Amulumruptor caecigallinarius]|nr:bifunctional oligoribonuclease/PAP phosphatase NrnA [Candidatus Amulumruptor caecigallinarius]MCM1397196.1 bifunctional oligoribonuclease/PAP phosphatase NrnA [Candidatus Amulumruptor caecigallinarius]MCM1453115.1 bifunctional oligoribonuclease/PAP phosphatase NrnA [bacterium]
MIVSKHINAEAVEAMRTLVERAHKVAITCHVSPDGDAMGSTLALAGVLNNMGKHAIVVTPDRPPKSLAFLPGAADVVSASYKQAAATNILGSSDLVMCLDFNAVKRVDKMAPLLSGAPAPKVMIDHHLDPEPFCDVTISVPQMSSTCELLYEVLKRLGWLGHLDTRAASCLYTGMMTDTGNFTYNSNDPELYLIIADLLSRGIDKDRLYAQACNTCSEECLRLNGYALSEKMKVWPEYQAALITLSYEELVRFGYVKGDTEGLVNRPLAIPGVTYSCFLREDEPGFVKVSMRSKGSFPVNVICERHFNGGGHRNASGGELDMTIDEATALFESLLDENKQQDI